MADLTSNPKQKFDEILAKALNGEIDPLAPSRPYHEPLDDTIWPTYGGITRIAEPPHADLNSTPLGLLGLNDVKQHQYNHHQQHHANAAEPIPVVGPKPRASEGESDEPEQKN